jgi:hypothetical protein
MEDFRNKIRYKCLISASLVWLVSCGCHTIKEPVSKLDLADAATSNQLLSGFWWLESNSWRWTARQFSAALQPPDNSEKSGATLFLRLYVPESQIALLGPMTLTATTEGHTLEPETYAKGGIYVYTRELPKELMATSLLPVRFTFDKALPPANSDGRELAAIVTGIELQTN